MSYEGYSEYITKDGHYLVVDCWESDPIEWEWTHSVDQTNGPCEDRPECLCCRSAPKVVIGSIEHEHKDFKGNVYFTREWLYAPKDQSDWRRRVGDAEKSMSED